MWRAGATLVFCLWRFSHCRAWAPEHMDFGSCSVTARFRHSMWDLPRPGIEPMSPKLAGRFLPTGLPGKSLPSYLTVGGLRPGKSRNLPTVAQLIKSLIRGLQPERLFSSAVLGVTPCSASVPWETSLCSVSGTMLLTYLAFRYINCPRVLYSGNSSEPPLDGSTTCIQRGWTPPTQANSPPGCPTAALGVTEGPTP